MPYQIKFDKPPAGYSMSSLRPGYYGWVCTREFVSSEDGDLFISRLEGFPTVVLSLIGRPRSLLPSMVDHMVVIIRKDGTATAYINEVSFLGLIRSKRAPQAGEVIYSTDIADVQKLRMQNVTVPPDAGYLILFSVGWRKGLLYDFDPLGGEERDHDVEVLLGQRYAYLLRQQLFKLSEAEWERLMDQRWFPFISLEAATVEKMINHVRNDWNVDELLDEIACEVKKLVEGRIVSWRQNPFFEKRGKLLEEAVQQYRDGHYISAIHVVYPQIEGILRVCHSATDASKDRSQSSLIEAGLAYAAEMRHACSYLLPHKFDQYLREITFAGFDPDDPQDVSRNTISHGVAPEGEFSLKEATLAFLVLDQLYYFLSGREAASD